MRRVPCTEDGSFLSRQLQQEQQQQRMVTVPKIGIGFDDNPYVELFGSAFDDNSSYKCPSSCLPCHDGDPPLWWLILRWMKMMLLKLAHSYNAKPVILIIAPLLTGVAIGYFLGRRQPMIVDRERNQYHPYSSYNHWWFRIQHWFPLMYFRFLDTWLPLTYQPTTQSLVDEATTTDVLVSNAPSVDLPTPDPSQEIEGITPVEKEDDVRANLKSDEGMEYESGVDPNQVPKHVAVIMDGNRRYGKAKYGSISRGHWDGSSKLVEFAKWCIAEQISVLTVYAFSTENWTRDPSEVASLMAIFAKYCDELRIEALKRNIRIHVLSTDSTRVSTNPWHPYRMSMKHVKF